MVPSPKPTTNLETVYTVTNPVQAEFIKNLLTEHGIPCELDGDHQAGFTGALEIGVLVRQSDADKARDVLKYHHVDDHADASSEGDTADEAHPVDNRQYPDPGTLGVSGAGDEDSENAFRLDR